MATFDKDPNAELDYSFDWRPFLGIDTINEYTLTSSSADLVVVQAAPRAPAEADGIITFWLTGGHAGVMYSVTCHIVTAAGRVDDRTMRIRGVEK